MIGYLKRIIFLAFVLTNGVHVYAQSKELESFRAEVVAYMQFDRTNAASANDSLMIARKNMLRERFHDFAMHPANVDLEALKSQAKNSKNTYWYDQWSYTFSSFKMYFGDTAKSQSPVHSIVFYGVYDYQTSNFVHLSFRQINVGKRSYVVHSYSLNGEAYYIIRDFAGKKLLYASTYPASGFPVYGIYPLDKKHVLMIEESAIEGQRVSVFDVSGDKWIKQHVFEGKTLSPDNPKTLQPESALRNCMQMRSNKTIASHQSMNYLRQYGITFDPATGMLFHKDAGGKLVQSKWVSGKFVIDDYYLGNLLPDEEMPMPFLD